MATSAEILLDTSAAIPFLIRGHASHPIVRSTLSGRELGLAGHAAFETYSVLTRLPEPARLSPRGAATVLAHNFPRTAVLSARRTAALVSKLADAGISGGAVYDALVGAAAAERGSILATRDRRALTTYAGLGVEVLLLD